MSPRVQPARLPAGRQGRRAGSRRARAPTSEIVAFSDANATWAPDALRRLVANLADPDVAYVCGQLRLEDADGREPRGPLLALRDGAARGGVAARLGHRAGTARSTRSTASDYVEVDPRWGHDLSFPYRMVQAGSRAVYEPAAHAFEKPTPSNETEYRRKVRMFEHCWEITLRGSMLRGLPPGYLVAMLSHRVLRYGSGVLHLVLLAATSLALAVDGWSYAAVLAGQVALARGARGGRSGSRATTCSSPGRRVAGARELPAPRRPGHVGGAGGTRDEPRSLDVAIAGAGLGSRHEPAARRSRRSRSSSRTVARSLYRQTRVGKDGEDFELLKLRSMVVGAESQGRGLRRRRGRRRGSRVSGAILRRTSVDELPQLWNVVRGDMSVIGPRPTLALPGRAVQRAPAPAARRSGRG